MATETAMTLQEAIRTLDGVRPWLPPGPAEKLAQVLLRAAEAEGQLERLRKDIPQAEGELAGVRSQIAAARQQHDGILQSERSVREELQKGQEELRQVQNSFAARRALVEKADALIAEVQKYITIFRP